LDAGEADSAGETTYNAEHAEHAEKDINHRGTQSIVEDSTIRRGESI
jgi:hypothetical protein